MGNGATGSVEAGSAATKNALSLEQPVALPAQPVVSVIIPIYNGAETITPVMEALYQSSFDNFETVVIHDCSTDNSAEVLAELNQKYPFRLFEFPENRGVSKARNLSLIHISEPT